MPAIKETIRKIFLDGGRTVEVVVRDGLLVDHLLVQGMKAEGYRVMTGREAFPVVTRKLKDYLIRTGVISE